MHDNLLKHPDKSFIESFNLCHCHGFCPPMTLIPMDYFFCGVALGGDCEHTLYVRYIMFLWITEVKSINSKEEHNLSIILIVLLMQYRGVSMPNNVHTKWLDEIKGGNEYVI